MPFEQITHTHVHFTEPTISLGKSGIFFNKACADLANLHAMKAVDIFWDDVNRVLKLKPSHIRGDNSFLISKPNPSTWWLVCGKFVHRIKPKTANGPLHIPARWDEKEKAFIAVVGKGKP
jgi:hypothetical protein